MRKFLLCIDNAEEIIEHDGKRFKQLVARIINECTNLSIIITSRKNLGPMDDCIQSSIHVLHALKPQYSVEFFLEQTDIEAEEILELIKLDKNYPL